jgi:hypothetical protein
MSEEEQCVVVVPDKHLSIWDNKTSFLERGDLGSAGHFLGV